MLEWQRSYDSSQIRPIRGEASKEIIALDWDPESQGGIARYIPLMNDYVYSLMGHVGVGESSER